MNLGKHYYYATFFVDAFAIKTIFPVELSLPLYSKYSVLCRIHVTNLRA